TDARGAQQPKAGLGVAVAVNIVKGNVAISGNHACTAPDARQLNGAEVAASLDRSPYVTQPDGAVGIAGDNVTSDARTFQLAERRAQRGASTRVAHHNFAVGILDLDRSANVPHVHCPESGAQVSTLTHLAAADARVGGVAGEALANIEKCNGAERCPQLGCA